MQFLKVPEGSFLNLFESFVLSSSQELRSACFICLGLRLWTRFWPWACLKKTWEISLDVIKINSLLNLPKGIITKVYSALSRSLLLTLVIFWNAIKDLFFSPQSFLKRREGISNIVFGTCNSYSIPAYFKRYRYQGIKYLMSSPVYVYRHCMKTSQTIRTIKLCVSHIMTCPLIISDLNI